MEVFQNIFDKSLTWPIMALTKIYRYCESSPLYTDSAEVWRSFQLQIPTSLVETQALPNLSPFTILFLTLGFLWEEHLVPGNSFVSWTWSQSLHPMSPTCEILKSCRTKVYKSNFSFGNFSFRSLFGIEVCINNWVLATEIKPALKIKLADTEKLWGREIIG